MSQQHREFRWIGPRPRKASVIARLETMISRRMTVDEIELEYFMKYGPVTRRTILMELSRLAHGEVIHRVKQGVYEP
jgi:hypothetical protein